MTAGEQPRRLGRLARALLTVGAIVIGLVLLALLSGPVGAPDEAVPPGNDADALTTGTLLTDNVVEPRAGATAQFVAAVAVETAEPSEESSPETTAGASAASPAAMVSSPDAAWTPSQAERIIVPTASPAVDQPETTTAISGTPASLVAVNTPLPTAPETTPTSATAAPTEAPTATANAEPAPTEALTAPAPEITATALPETVTLSLDDLANMEAFLAQHRATINGQPVELASLAVASGEGEAPYFVLAVAGSEAGTAFTTEPADILMGYGQVLLEDFRRYLGGAPFVTVVASTYASADAEACAQAAPWCQVGALDEGTNNYALDWVYLRIAHDNNGSVVEVWNAAP